MRQPTSINSIIELEELLKLIMLCVLGNLCPETVEEAVAMVPSVKTKGRSHTDDAIEKMLHDLSLIKKFE
ncbi:hypothetical protein ZOSMA_184G00120 [Zostera marina]|uniref:RNA polymerase Rpb4/RPC9 core domain-containing protein n=1 Tax=Zostera marina TaxID=29655 RepID=A0A0K9PQL7_ZOSMR|nr:hypothetical protein ZOSMA_184G00120 [Zostera marina]